MFLFLAGYDSANAIGIFMSATPKFAIICPSINSTIECTKPSGWMSTSICSGSRSNNHFASIISSPLFMSVAESTDIFLPMDHMGCAIACSGVASLKAFLSTSKNGPPEPVIYTFESSYLSLPYMHWKMAQCSLSTGIRSPP